MPPHRQDVALAMERSAKVPLLGRESMERPEYTFAGSELLHTHWAEAAATRQMATRHTGWVARRAEMVPDPAREPWMSIPQVPTAVAGMMDR